jgi:DNA-binding NtrC family response regulator
VRELRNAVERAVLLTDSALLTAADLPPEIRITREPGAHSDDFRIPESGLILEELERDLVRQALERAGGNRTQAARLLGLNRDQIRYRIEKFHLEENAEAAEED